MDVLVNGVHIQSKKVQELKQGSLAFRVLGGEQYPEVEIEGLVRPEEHQKLVLPWKPSEKLCVQERVRSCQMVVESELGVYP